MRQGLANQTVEKISASTANPREERLKDEILRRLNRVGRSCAPDLANELEIETTPDELLPILKSLMDEGLIREVRPGSKDTRDYKRPYQTRYELAL